MANMITVAEAPIISEAFNLRVTKMENTPKTPPNAPKTAITNSQTPNATPQSPNTASKRLETATLEITVYKEDGTFVPQCNYLFEAVDGNNQPLTNVNVVEFKKAVDEYCTEVLATEYYVKSIPKTSSLCNEEMQAFNF